VSSHTSWRNGNAGIGTPNGNSDGLSFDSVTLFGNNSTNISAAGTSHLKLTGTNVIASDPSFTTTSGINWISGTVASIDIVNLDMSGSGTGFTTHTFDLNFAALCSVNGTINNSKFASTSPIAGKTSWWTKASFISFEKMGQTSGDHRTEMTYGVLKTDTTIYNTASPSMRMTPNNASNKLESAPRTRGKTYKIDSGGTVTATVSVRKSVSGDGAAYNGNQPRLIARANPAIGIMTDTVLGTYSSGAGSWNSLSGTTVTATDDGVVEVIVDCDGTTGWISVDDWA